MDLIFKRYSSPFFYIDALVEYGEFARGVATILEEDKNDRVWQMYLSNNPYNKKSFKDWKNELYRQEQVQKPLSNAQVVATVEKSQDILKNFKPPKKT